MKISSNALTEHGSLENIMTFSHYGFTNLLLSLRTPSYQYKQWMTTIYKFHNLHVREGLPVTSYFSVIFSHSVNCSDRVSVKIDHGSVNRPPIFPIHHNFVEHNNSPILDEFKYHSTKVLALP